MSLMKKIRTENSNYIYDTWTNKILKVDDVVFHLLPDGDPILFTERNISELEKQQALSEIKNAKEQGFFRDEYPVIESFGGEGFSESIKALIQSGPDQMILSITENCNLRCKYCTFSGSYHSFRTHSEKTMSLKMAITAIDWYLSHKDRDGYAIGFYGGEPLLAFPLIRKIVEYTRQKVGNRAKFNMTTNGVLLNEEIAGYLISEDFTLTISLDGPRIVHDRYRVDKEGRGSFAAVWDAIHTVYQMNQDYFYLKVFFNMVMAQPVEMLEIHRFIEAYPEIFKGNRLINYPVSNKPSDFINTLSLNGLPKDTNSQSHEIYSSFKEHIIKTGQIPDGFPGAIYHRNYIHIHQRPMTLMSAKVASHGQCIPSSRKCFVSTDGQMYMCEKLCNVRPIGSVFTGLDPNVIVEFLKEYNAFFNEPCRKCWAVRLCLKCFNSVNHMDEFDRENLNEFCQAMRKGLFRTLAEYCHIREQNDNAFAWTESIEIS